MKKARRSGSEIWLVAPCSLRSRQRELSAVAFLLAKTGQIANVSLLPVKPLFALVSFALIINTAPAAEKPSAAKGKLTAIQGIAEATEKKLNAAGITNVDELLEKGATPAGRKEIAAKSGLGDA